VFDQISAGNAKARELGFLGGRERCDFTENPLCTDGGQLDTAAAAPSAPGSINGTSIVSRAYLALSIAGRETVDVDFGLWDAAAPISVRTFSAMAAGVYAKGRFSFAGSSIWRVDRDVAVYGGRLAAGAGSRAEKVVDDIGRVRVTMESAAGADTYNNEDTGVALDRAGLLLMRRGGGSFDYAITMGPAQALANDWIAIGQVTGGMDTALAEINRVPTVSKDSYEKSAYLSLGEATGDKRASLARQGGGPRPLKKIVAYRSGMRTK